MAENFKKKFETKFKGLEKKVLARWNQTDNQDLKNCIFYRLREARNYVKLSQKTGTGRYYPSALIQLEEALKITAEEAYRAEEERRYDEYERKVWGS